MRLRTPGFRRRDLTLDGAMTARLRIVRAEATDENLQVVLRLIDEAAQWLHTKDTDQWARPWPDPTSRDERVRRGLEGKKTWFVQDVAQNTLATVTIATHANRDVWPSSAWADESTHNSDAVYVHRLIVARGSPVTDWGRICSTGQGNGPHGSTEPTGSGSTSGLPTQTCISTARAGASSPPGSVPIPNIRQGRYSRRK